MSVLDVFQAYTEAVNKGDLATLEELLHDDFQMSGAGLDGLKKREFLGTLKARFEAFPDYSENPTDIDEDAQRVNFVVHVTGTHEKKLVLPGIATVEATGKRVELPPEPGWVAVVDEKIRRYHLQDVPGGGMGGMLAQLGSE